MEVCCLKLLTFFGSMSSKWFCINCTVAVKSDWLNSYGIFQPIGPNFLRSWTVVCKKATPYNIGFHCGRLLYSSCSWKIIKHSLRGMDTLTGEKIPTTVKNVFASLVKMGRFWKEKILSFLSWPLRATYSRTDNISVQRQTENWPSGLLGESNWKCRQIFYEFMHVQYIPRIRDDNSWGTKF